jgi:phosphoribosylamine--glycine ligase
MKFLVFSEFGEIADLGIHLQDVEGHEVLFHVEDKEWRKIADGILTHVRDWYRYIGKGYVWVFDSCSFGDLQDWLREKGESVFGGCKEGDKLENDRQAGQDWFAEAGFDEVESQNFKDFESAVEFIKARTGTKYILKQNGSAPKSLSHMGKFDDSSDMLYHLDGLKKRWNEAQYGAIDFDLMEVVEGLEVAASAFFNGSDWMRDAEGKVCGYLNFEEKKEADGGTGETTGEMGTTFWGCNEDNELFHEMICRPKIKERLKKICFRGVFDINCIVTDEGKIVALEPTCRLGVPATSYEFCEGLESGAGKLIEAVAKGQKQPVAVYQNWGMVMVVVAKPFPLEADVDEEATSIGERLWILDEGEPVTEFSTEQKKHIHLYNFKRDDEGLKVVSKSGYLLTVTAKGEDIAKIREGLIEYIKANLMIAGMKYRQDIGLRVEEHEKEAESVHQAKED